MNIRLAQPAQAPMLAALDNARPFSAHWTLAGWQGELAQTASHIWCAEQDGTVVGFIALRGVCGLYEITNLAVHAAHTRRGIGRQLLTCVLEKLSGQITLEVSVQNTAAIGLYEQMGFERLGVRQQFYTDGTDALVMGRTV